MAVSSTKYQPDSNNQDTFTLVKKPQGTSILYQGKTLISNGDGTYSIDDTPATPQQGTVAALDTNRAYAQALSGNTKHLTLGGVTIDYFTKQDPKDPTQPMKDANDLPIMFDPTNGQPLDLQKNKDGSLSFTSAALSGLQAKYKLDEAQAKKINEELGPNIEVLKQEAGLKAAQTGLTGAQTDVQKQQFIGALTSDLSRIASGPGDLAYKQQMMQTVSDGYYAKYKDVVNQAAALNSWQQTLVSQANNARQSASSTINGAINGVSNWKYGNSGGAIAALLGGAQGFMNNMGGGIQNLKDPTTLWGGGPHIDASTVPTLDQLFPKAGGGPGGGALGANGRTGGVTPPGGSPPGTNPPTSLLDYYPDESGRSGIGGGVGGTGLNIMDVLHGINQPASGITAQVPGLDAVPPSPSATPNALNALFPGVGGGLANAANAMNPLTQLQNAGNAMSGLGSNFRSALTAQPTNTGTPPVNINYSSGMTPEDMIRAGMAPYTGDIPILPSQFGSQFAPVPAYAKGGTVPGKPGQAVPIIAHGGERVVPSPIMPEHPVLPEHMQQIQAAIKSGLSPLQAVLHTHAKNGGDADRLLASTKKGSK